MDIIKNRSGDRKVIVKFVPFLILFFFSLRTFSSQNNSVIWKNFVSVGRVFWIFWKRLFLQQLRREKKKVKRTVFW